MPACRYDACIYDAAEILSRTDEPTKKAILGVGRTEKQAERCQQQIVGSQLESMRSGEESAPPGLDLCNKFGVTHSAEIWCTPYLTFGGN